MDSQLTVDRVNEPGVTIGEITKKSPFFGYRNKESSKKKVLCDVFRKGDSYFLTGDVMRMDEEGWVFFCDRSGDTFRWKGENVSTAEVESIISEILKLTDVEWRYQETKGELGWLPLLAPQSPLIFLVSLNSCSSPFWRMLFHCLFVSLSLLI